MIGTANRGLGSTMPTDFKSINRNDQVVMVAAILGFIASFFPFYGASVTGLGSASVNAWHSYGFLGVLLLLIGGAIIAAKVFASLPDLPVGVHVAAAAAAGLGTLILLLHGLTFSHPTVPGISWGMKWGAYVIIIVGAIETAFAFMGARESGEDIPGMSSGSGGATAPPPPPPPPPPAA
jgi:hypothetical protein